ncbi:hypothetical protein GCM10026982_57560 [Nocardiopsis aegyptia]
MDVVGGGQVQSRLVGDRGVQLREAALGIRSQHPLPPLTGPAPRAGSIQAAKASDRGYGGVSIRGSWGVSRGREGNGPDTDACEV